VQVIRNDGGRAAELGSRSGQVEHKWRSPRRRLRRGDVGAMEGAGAVRTRCTGGRVGRARGSAGAWRLGATVGEVAEKAGQ
jgi:hypothetical protein